MISQTKKSAISITREDISLSDVEILRRYMDISTLPCSISSPLRDDDKIPSFSFQERGDTVVWKDFGTGEKGTLIKLLAKLWKVNYNEALLKIKLDEGSRIPKFDLIRRYKGRARVNKNSTIKVRVREWKDYDIEYWGRYGITKEFATWCNVYPISHAIFISEEKDGKKKKMTIAMDKYAYAYFEWKDGKQSIKLYQPFSQTMKWLSKHDQSVWDLWKQAFWYAEKYGNEAVIITSSRKDAMCIWNNLKIPAMSLQGEGYLPKPQVMKQVFQRFKNVYIWYDNDFSHESDNPGQDNAKKLTELYPQLKNICIPSEFQCKDPSDLYKEYGKEALMTVWHIQKSMSSYQSNTSITDYQYEDTDY